MDVDTNGDKVEGATTIATSNGMPVSMDHSLKLPWVEKYRPKR